MGAPTPAVSLACPITFINDPAANPYRVEFACALALLLTVFIVWRRVRPPSRKLLRYYAGTGGAITFVVMQAQACIHFGREDREYGCLLVLKLSLLVAASLLAEILLSVRQRRAPSRAVARARRSRRR